MKLGYLVPEFPGQTHNFFWREISALVEEGIEVHLFSTRRAPLGVNSPSWSSTASARTCYLFPLRAESALMALLSLLRAGPRRVCACLWVVARVPDLKLLARVKMLGLLLLGARLARECRATGVVHVHVHSCGDSANIALFMRILSGIEYSLTLHNPVSTYGGNQVNKWQYAKFGIAITQPILDDLRSQLKERAPRLLGVAPMGVDTEVFRRKRNYVPPAARGPLRLFCCGRLNPAKGHVYLLEALRQLLWAGADSVLTLAGEDDVGGVGYRRDLERAIERLELTRHVRLLGAVSEDVVCYQLEEAHIFVLPSIEEPLGVALMEAMAMEVPVVATDAGGVPGLIADGTHGLLVPSRSVSAIRDAVLRLAADPDLAIRLGKNGRLRVEESFSHRVSAAKIVGFLALAQTARQVDATGERAQ